MKKDYSDEDYRKPDVDFMNRSVQPRMPWHDVACSVEGPAVTDFVRHFVQRYNYESDAKDLAVNGKIYLCMLTWVMVSVGTRGKRLGIA